MIDALRGFALIGVLLMNLQSFSGLRYLTGEQRAALPASAADDFVSTLVTIFVGGKFVSLFSLLFGVGFALMLVRAQSRSVNLLPYYSRRLITLLLFGYAHAFLLFYTDILHAYALVGFLLLFIYKRSDRTVFIGALLLVVVLSTLSRMLVPSFELFTTWIQSRPDKAQLFQSYATGSYLDVIQANWTNFIHYISFKNPYTYLLALPETFGWFLLGLWVGRKRIFHDVETHRPLLRKLLWWGLGIGLVAGALPLLPRFGLFSSPAWWGSFYVMMLGPNVVGLAIFYASGFALLYQRPTWKKRLDIFAPVGRMALTNYLMQSVIAVWIFLSYGWGLELFGKVSYSACLSIWLAVYAFQVLYSRWWLERYRFGPVEWLWRSLTYGKLQPMRK